jgi:sensor histidine kinase YesM
MKGRWAKWLIIWGGWTLAAFFLTAEILSRSERFFPMTALETLVRELIFNYIWFALTPLVIHLARRFPVGTGNGWRNLFFHLPAGILLTLAHVAIYSLVIHVSGLAVFPMAYFQRFQYVLSFNFHSSLFCYWIVFGITSVVDAYRRQRENDLRRAQLETRLAHSQLAALKSQIHPHFLFNALNTISVLMEKDAKEANRMLVSLSGLLRAAIDQTETLEISLKEEMDFLERYLKIEQTRFEERLKIKTFVAPEALSAQVPNLLLQPLVENAVRHGIAPQIAGGTIEIGARREGDALYLYVRDDGGANESAKKSRTEIKEGVGLSNTRARLSQMYNAGHSFRIENENGFAVHITIPFKENGAGGA